MIRFFTLFLLMLAVVTGAKGAVTLDYCLQRAEENYPEIRNYGLIDNLTELNLSEINRSWLPKATVYAQGNVQNIVPAFPDALRNVLASTGYEMKGMGKFQYKIAADVNQTIWDGGASKSSRKVERADAEASRAALDVELYGIRRQVESVYFGILLMEDQIAQTLSTISLLEANLKRIQSMVKNGTAMQSDADMVEAQWLTLRQSLAEARTATAGYRAVLGIYTGEDMSASELICPDATLPSSLESARPELTLFDKKIGQNLARENAIKSSLMPRVSLFAQAYYGYPGYNYFEGMTNRNLSFNIMAGVKIAWNIESLYTKDLSRKKLQTGSAMIETDRDLFLYNIRLQTARDEAAILGIREVMKEDARIVELRKNVRISAESQLANGVIDATTLLSKINDENQARLNSAYHKIQLVQNIYQLKNTLNR